MNVFLSHSTKDADFVQKLAIAIEAEGFTPWLCEVGIEKGENFVAKINQGLAQSDVAVLVWSPDAAKSAWTEQEWTTLLAQQVEEHKIRLAIIMLRDHPRPALLRTSNYIDARWDEAGGIRQTLEWLKGRQRVQRLAGLRAPVYLPDYRPQDFVGRSAYLARLQDTLTAEPGVFLLYGEPGAGKSTLALRFAWDAQKDFDAVIFQTCGQRPLDAVTAELVERLPIDVKTRPPEEQRAAAKGWLRERQSLLVLDDVWSAEMRQLEPGPPCSVLHTSRKHTLPGIASKQTAEVEKFTEAEAEELFHTYLDPVFGESDVTHNREALLGFAKRVELLPIAVAVGASMLREKSASPLTRAALKLRLESLADGAKDVNALFRTAIESQAEREQRLLAAGAVCVQEGFWLPLAVEIAELNEDDADDAADHLVHSSLLRVVDRERRRFSLHALLRDEVRAQQGDGLVKLQDRHAMALERLFRNWEIRWRECRECLEEICAATRFLWARKDRVLENNLSDWGCELSNRVGERDLALRLLNLREELRAGSQDPQVRLELGIIYGDQALIFADWGRLEKALALHKKEEAIYLEVGDERGLSASFGHQAVILAKWGRLKEAIELIDKQEAISLRLGDESGLQHSYGNRVPILAAWGRLEEAMALLKKQEAFCLAMDDRDALARTYGNQAVILKTWGRFDEALEMLRKVEAICRDLGSLGSLGVCYTNWGLLSSAQGDYTTGKEKLEQALAIFTELRMPFERDEVQAELDKLGEGG